MSGTPPGEGEGGRRAKTLGDLLRAGEATRPVPEEEWVTLVGCIAAGQQRALQTLYERSHRVVFTLISRITNNRATAEELTVDVFHDVWRRAATYDPAGGSVIGWILNQARSRAIDRLRFEQRKKRSGDPADEVLPASGDRGPHELLELRERGRRVRTALAVLTADERRAIETAFFSELTYIEAAARLHQPPGTVKTRIRSGLAKLRQALDGTL